MKQYRRTGDHGAAIPATEPTPVSDDPLRRIYRDSVTRRDEILAALEEHRTALLVIDIQYLDAAPGVGVFAEEPHHLPEEAQAYYFETLNKGVLPNVRTLQDAFRAAGLEVIHTRIQSLTRDGRDRSPGHKRLHLHAAPGSKEAEFLPEVAPQGDEIVINKTASGVFNSTNIEYVLRNLHINALFVAGVYTNECVETTVRDASDLGFYVTLVEDACTTVTRELHEATINTLRDRYAQVVTTQEAIGQLATKLAQEL